jgi:hypothetical protein
MVVAKAYEQSLLKVVAPQALLKISSLEQQEPLAIILLFKLAEDNWRKITK